jgi:hypothetical protein
MARPSAVAAQSGHGSSATVCLVPGAFWNEAIETLTP